jgi:hypothetical protein
MAGYVYKTTNLKNGMWYIGSHNGKKPTYLGSGLLLKRAITKYGKDSFQKEILYEGEDFRNQEEQILQRLDALSDPRSYNLKNEALGGSFPGNLNGMFGKKLTPEQRFECGSAFRGKKRPDHSIKMSGTGNPMAGKTHQTHGLLKRAEYHRGKTFEEIFGEAAGKDLKRKLSASQLGKKHSLKQVICPHCEKLGSGPNMTRYHFGNCKSK